MQAPVEPDDAIVAIQHSCGHEGPGTRSVVSFRGARGVAALGCPSEPLILLARHTRVADLIAELRPEFELYRATGGGVTLAGDEATEQPSFALALTRTLQAEANVHVALATGGAYRPGDEQVAALLAAIELVLFDIELFDESRQLAANRHIKTNLDALQRDALLGRGPPVWPRMPVVPSRIADEANVRAWAQWLAERSFHRVTLVPHHEYGADEYGADEYGADEYGAVELAELPAGDRFERIAAGFAAHGITACAPGCELESS